MYVRYKLECDYTKSFGFFFLKGWNIESSYFFCIVVAVDIFHVTKLQIYSQQSKINCNFIRTGRYKSFNAIRRIRTPLKDNLSNQSSH